MSDIFKVCISEIKRLNKINSELSQQNNNIKVSHDLKKNAKDIIEDREVYKYNNFLIDRNRNDIKMLAQTAQTYLESLTDEQV